MNQTRSLEGKMVFVSSIADKSAHVSSKSSHNSPQHVVSAGQHVLVDVYPTREMKLVLRGFLYGHSHSLSKLGDNILVRLCTKSHIDKNLQSD